MTDSSPIRSNEKTNPTPRRAWARYWIGRRGPAPEPVAVVDWEGRGTSRSRVSYAKKACAVESYTQVVDNVHRFHDSLEEGVGIETRLSHFRAWYYVPEADLVAPSKFIGYLEMTGSEYMK